MPDLSALAARLKSPLALLVSLTLLRGLLYLSLFPPFFGPDEAAHFEAIRLIGQERKWPTQEVYQTTPMHPQMDTVFEQFRLWQLVGLYSPTRNLGVRDNLFIHYYPPQIAGNEVSADAYLMLYHLGVAPVAALLAPLPLTAQVYLLRLVSVLLAAGVVAAAWRTFRLVFPDRPVIALSACAFILFWPMHTHVTASINSDTLAELVASLFMLVGSQTMLTGPTRRRLVLLVALAGLGLLIKPTAFFLLPTLLAGLLIYTLRRFRGWSPARITAGLLAGTVLVWAGGIFVYLNTGAGRRPLAFLTDGLRWPDWAAYLSPSALAYYVQSANFAVLSFAGLFGWSNLHIPWSWVRVWAVVLGLLIFGGGWFCFRVFIIRQGDFSDSQIDVLLLWLAALLFAFVGVTMPIFVTQSRSWGIHSRYYFPAIIPLAFFLTSAARQLLPARLRRFFWPAWPAAWAVYDAVIVVFILIPFIYS